MDPERVEEFLDARRAAGYRSYVAASSVRLPLDYLIAIGVAPLLDAAVAPSSVDRLLEKYRRYPLLERRLADTTIAGYECVARVFLKHRVRRCGGLELERLSAADVSEFVAFECRRLTDGVARGQLAARLPAPILAERIGIHQARAAQWVRLAGSTYVDHVADRNAI